MLRQAQHERVWGAVTALLLLTAAAPPAPSTYDRAIAAGYKALTLCSAVFNAGRTQQQVEADELRGIYPEYDTIVPQLSATVQNEGQTGMVSVPFDATLPPRAATWWWQTGCAIWPIGSRPDLVTVRERVPNWKLMVRFSADPRPWPRGDEGISPQPAPALATAVAAAFDHESFGVASETVGVVVVRDGHMMAEHYRDGFGPFVSNRTWSVAKSISGTLIGMAGLDPRRAATVPEWATPGDPRSAITLDDLLRMASGLHSGAAGNRTDAIYFGGVAVTEEATAWPLEAKPGTRFRYANDDILLAIRALRASLGDERYNKFPAASLFEPLGMAHTIAETDWRGNYILSSQVWSTARDLARLGQFWLQDGVWQGERLLPEGWMRYMTTPSGPQPAEGPGYGATLWLFGSKQGLPAGSYAAQGNRGQFVMVVPSERLVVVRRGEDPGAARFDIAAFTARVIAALHR